MRQDRFTLDNLMSYIYGEQISKIPPKLYNDDAQVKYLDFGSLYTYCCHGSKEHQIRRWLRERIAYVDSMMGYYTSQEDQVTIRMNKTGYVEFEITPYIPLYLTVKWSNATGGTQTFRVGRGETKKFYYTSTTSTDQEILIPYASQIKRLDNLSNLNPSSCILSNATKLTNVEIHSTELYNINVTNNKYLRRVDLKDCTALGTVTATGSSLNLSNCKYLRYCNVYNTALTEVQLNTSGGSLIEIYYPKTIQNVQLIKQRLLETIGLPYGSGGAEIPTSLYNIDIEECPSIKKLNTSTDNSINNTFASMVYCNNLTLRNALDLRELNFDGFHRLTKVIIENMYNLQVIGFNNLLPKGETSTIKYIGLSNCPLLETIEMNCTSNDYEITFSDGAILNFGGLLALKTITSNCVLKGIKTIVLPLQLESMFFTNEYGEGYSTVQNLWSSAVCSVNTDGATPKATHIDSTYIGIDFANMNLKNIDLGALVNIPKAINFSLSPTTVNPHFNLNRDGVTYPYLKPVGTLDLSNYTESLARFFDGVDLDKLQIVCNNNLPQTDLSYCFYNSSFSSLSAIENLLTRVSNITNLDYCFYRTTIDSLNVLNGINMGANSSMNYTFAECPNIRTLSNITISRNVTSVEGMFKGCPLTSISNITVNVSGSINGLFMGCSQLTTINTFRIPNVTDLSNVFSGCSNLTTLTGFELPSSVTNISNLFNGCYALTTIENFTFSNNITEANTWYPPYLETLQNITINSSAVKLTNCTTLTTIRDFTLGTSDCSRMFEGCTSITSDIELPSTIVNCSNMFKNCTSITHIHSNWDNIYDSEITATDCYSGCTAITHIDEVALELNDYTSGLDQIPMAWGGYEFTKETTGLYKVNISSDNYTLNFDPNSKGFLVANGAINWGDGTITIGETSHTYTTAGEYVIKGKVHCYSDNNASIKESLVEVYTIPTPNKEGILSSFSNCTKLTNVTIRNQDLTYSGIGGYSVTFKGCSSMQKIDLNGSYGFTLNNTYLQFQDCLGILDLSNCRFKVIGEIPLKYHKFSEVIMRNATLINTASLKGFFNRGGGDTPSLTKVDLTGTNTSAITDFSEMFYSCKNLTTIIGIENLDLSSATTLAKMFYNCALLQSLDLSSWNVPQVAIMSSMFERCTSLHSLNLSNWNAPQLTNMSFMFQDCTSLQSLNLTNLNTSKVNSTRYMFYGCTSLQSLDLSSWNVPQVASMDYMFYNCKSLTEDIIIPSTATNCYGMFKGCTSMTHIHSNWNNSYGVNNDDNPDNDLISTDCYSGCIGITHIDNKNVISYEGDLGLDYVPEAWGGGGFTPEITSVFEVVIPSDGYNVVLSANSDYGASTNWGDLVLDSSISHTYSKSGTYIIKTKNEHINTTSSSVTIREVLTKILKLRKYIGLDFLFRQCYKVTSINLDNCVLPNTQLFYRTLRGNTTELSMVNTKLPSDTSKWNYMIDEPPGITEIRGIEDLDVSHVTSFQGLFNGFGNLTSLDLSKWDVSKATNMNSMFKGCSSLTEPPIKNIPSSVKNTANMYYGCTSLTKDVIIPTTVTDCSEMFKNCTSMTHIHSNWKNGYINEIISTDCYTGCTAITHIDNENVIKSDYSEGLDQIPISWGGYEFYNGLTTIIEVEIPNDNYSLQLVKYTICCTKWEDIRIVWGDGTSTSTSYANGASAIDITHVYEKAGTYIIKGHFTFGNGYPNLAASVLKRVFQICGTRDCVYLFYNCKKLTYVNLSTLTKTERGKFDAAFKNCTALETIDGLEYIHPKSALEMFYGCTSLTRLNGIQNLDTRELTKVGKMFYGCTSLQSLDLSNWVIQENFVAESLFDGCTSLTTIIGMENWNINNFINIKYMFRNCKSLTSITMPNFNPINKCDVDELFNGCNSLINVKFNITGWHMSNKIIGWGARLFQDCRSLTELDLSSWVFDEQVTIDGLISTFRGLTNCQTINLSSWNLVDNNTNASWGFADCPNLVNLNLGNNITLKGVHDRAFDGDILLSPESAVSIFNALADLSGTNSQTLRLPSEVIARLTPSQISIATNKNWNVTKTA